MAVRIAEIAVVSAPIGAGWGFDDSGPGFGRKLHHLVDLGFRGDVMGKIDGGIACTFGGHTGICSKRVALGQTKPGAIQVEEGDAGRAVQSWQAQSVFVEFDLSLKVGDTERDHADAGFHYRTLAHLEPMHELKHRQVSHHRRYTPYEKD